EKIISAKNFGKSSFQANWKQGVGEIYKKAELPREWLVELKTFTEDQGLEFMVAPYDIEALEQLVEIGINNIKLGSGETSNLDFVREAARTGLPLILAAGACTLAEVDDAMNECVKAGNENVILLQCITQYPTPFHASNLMAMKAFADTFGCLVGYSDHTPGLAVPLGAVALGGRVIEKHFTDDKSRTGPDHSFAMDLKDFSQMATEIRNLEAALGSTWKRVEACEADTVVLQRRGLTTKKDIKKGEKLSLENTELLRPQKGLLPKESKNVMGKFVNHDIPAGTPVTWEDIG
ncbi:MAG: N-acetylneuraminate synthase, partial [Sphingobacteriales bacterium]